MEWSWLVWPVGAALLVAAGLSTTWLPRRRARRRVSRTAWSAARAAIDSATISRDAARVRIPEAERLLAQAESIAADRGGPSAADTATGYAQRADHLWRRAADRQDIDRQDTND
ncbi:DUF6403 family protein [Solwaraspora sp. WMMD406]|uniref:DUF6403 family protein n=1 Tax=Solwaraspora sp. WMMD406 TaxID=3016095 RepID=UPI002415C7CB|nr:DUF6403 family protein [Solwaraspora sp. WMMD406]MDG4765039.1 DUF6403 family protein [Solwaraspora sp. WMMD406]